MLEWKEGNTNNDVELYFGRLYIGCVRRVVPAKWREWDCYKSGPAKDSPQYMKDNTASQKRYYEAREAKPWRGWLMTDEDGEEVGWWDTLDGAKASMEVAAMLAISEVAV
jgi:hypothetical protein